MTTTIRYVVTQSRIAQSAIDNAIAHAAESGAEFATLVYDVVGNPIDTDVESWEADEAIVIETGARQ